MTFFAHDGHYHAPEPTFLEQLFANALPFALLALVLLVTHSVLHLSLKLQIIIALVFLLICGLTTFQWAPVASVVSLVAGFGLSLALILTPEKPATKKKH